MSDLSPPPKRSDVIPLSQAIPVWLRIAALSFGGPAGQIAVMHRILVEERRWISERRFLHALNYCMLLPGPEAQQLATYIGWLMNGVRGGLVAGGLFILPGLLAIMGLSVVYALYGGLEIISAVFFGLKAAVLAIVFQAVERIGKRTLHNQTLVAVAVAAFIGIFFLQVPFPAIILTAGLAGLISGRAGLRAFQGGIGHGADATDAPGEADTLLGESAPSHTRVNLAWSLRIGAVLLTLWLAPVLGLGLWLGWDDVFSRIALFFSQMAVVTFGGAYAVLAWVAQEAVESYYWLTAREMLDGLAMAESTPGPLIMVTQFVGFLGAFRAQTGLPPMLAGVLGGLLTTWVTFVPCFLWIFLGAPHIERLRQARAVNAALTAITAAVVGVIFHLAIWMAMHVLYRDVGEARPFGLRVEAPVITSLDPAAVVLTLLAAVAVFRYRVGAIPVLLACAAAGLVWHFIRTAL
jgi:chromate transporter